MTERNTILSELKELGASFGNEVTGNLYTVPANYFDQLADEVLRRIKAETAMTAADEIAILSPLLSDLSKKTYTVPNGYFESIDQRIEEVFALNVSADEELETLSPLLKGIRKEQTYSVPAGYFDSVRGTGNSNKDAKVISMSSKFMRYAAAAVITGIITTLTLVVLNNSQPDPNKDPGIWVEKKVMKKVDTEKVDEFVELAMGDPEANGTAIQPGEMVELMKDVSEEEIQQFLNETASAGTNETDVLLN